MPPQTRYMGASEIWPGEGPSWGRCTCHAVGSGSHLEARFFDRLRGGELRGLEPFCWLRRCYPTWSAAFLALAEALAGE